MWDDIKSQNICKSATYCVSRGQNIILYTCIATHISQSSFNQKQSPGNRDLIKLAM